MICRRNLDHFSKTLNLRILIMYKRLGRMRSISPARRNFPSKMDFLWRSHKTPLTLGETKCQTGATCVTFLSIQKLDKYAFLFYFCSKYALLSKIGFCDIWEKIHLGKASDLNINHAIKRCGAIQSDITAFTLYLAWEFFSAQYPWLAQTGRQLLR